jgi:hypothetical protein
VRSRVPWCVYVRILFARVPLHVVFMLANASAFLKICAVVGRLVSAGTQLRAEYNKKQKHDLQQFYREQRAGCWVILGRDAGSRCTAYGRNSGICRQSRKRKTLVYE